MKKLRLGIIGTGIATRDLYWPQLKKMRDKIEIVAVANRRKAKAAAFARLAKVKKVCENGEELLKLKEVDGVMLSLPIPLAAQWVMKALRAGKPVMCEKPLASHVAEGRRLVKAAAKFRLPFLVAENYFFAPHIVQARRWFKQGAIGRAHLAEASQVGRLTPDNKYYNTSWRQNPKFVGGFVVDAGVHVANILREMLGMPVSIQARHGLMNPLLKPVDTAVAALQFKGGVCGSWRSSFSAHQPYQVPMVRIYGSKGTIEVFYNHSRLLPLKGKAKTFRSPRNGFYEQFLHFRDVVLNGKKPAFSPRQALQDLEFMERIVK